MTSREGERTGVDTLALTGTGTPILEVSDLTVRFQGPRGWVTAVDRVSFAVAGEEVLGVVGESGSGKTVTGLSLLQLLPSRAVEVSGGAYYQGQNLLAMRPSEIRRLRGPGIAMIFQDPMSSLNPVIPVGVQIRDVIQLHKGLSRKAAQGRAVELMEMVEIPDARRHFHSYQHEFSGGMRQRIMIALALSCGPRLVIADEPTTALDVTIQAQILTLLNSLRKDLGMSIILISHDLGVIAAMCDRVNVMYAGSIVESGPTDEILSRPRMPYTVGLMDCLPQSSVHARKGRLPMVEGAPPEVLGRFGRCKFRDRCSYAHEICSTGEPQLTPRSPDHWARCWGTEADGWIT